MAINSVASEGTIEVFKFKGTGIVALCEEVASYFREPRDIWFRDIDPATARFEETETMFKVVFDA